MGRITRQARHFANVSGVNEMSGIGMLINMSIDNAMYCLLDQHGAMLTIMLMYS